MQTNSLIDLFDGTTALLCVVGLILAACGIAGKKANVGTSRSRARLFWVAAALTLFGLLKLASGLIAARPAGPGRDAPPSAGAQPVTSVSRTSAGTPNGSNWIRYTSSDGSCSAEFPSAPKFESRTTPGGKVNMMHATLDGGKCMLVLTTLHAPSANGSPTDDEVLEAMKKELLASAAAKVKNRASVRLTRDERINQDGMPGRDLEIAFGDGTVYRMKALINPEGIFQLSATGSRKVVEGEDVQHFLNSFQSQKTESK